MNEAFNELRRLPESALRSDVAKVNKLLVEAASTWPDEGPASRRAIINSVLAACAYDGPHALESGKVLMLLAPLRRPLVDHQAPSDYAAGLQSIARRPGLVRGSRMLEDLLRDLGADPTSDVGHLPEAGPSISPTTDHVPATTPDAPTRAIGLRAHVGAFVVGEVPQGLSLDDALRGWPQERHLLAASRRHEIDSWLVRSALLLGRPLPIDYADALSLDDDYWESDFARDVAASLVAPFSGEALGRLAAACLNSRLRRIRPRLFLQNPDTLVVAPIGERLDLKEAKAIVCDEVSYPVLRLATSLQEEMLRKAPRKTTLRSLESYLTDDVLRRLGVTLIGRVGEKTKFDPVLHQSIELLDAGTPVIILGPGLREPHNGLVRMQAQVVTPEAWRRAEQDLTTDPTQE